jgi:nucleotide-binding universal stress UspA family protein
MATHGRGGLGQAALGSTAEAVLRDSEHSLLLVGPEVASMPPEMRQGRLVVTTDGSKPSEAIWPTAARWTRELEMQPWIVEVLAPPSGTAGEPDPAVESGLVRHLAEKLSALSGVGPEWEVLHARDAADALVDYTTRTSAAITAMATHGRTGFARVALGSVAMQVVHRSACPVLVQRSAGLRA